jgi:hypothetical protein
MPYLYTVDGKHYRGTRYDVTGNFVGTKADVSAKADDQSMMYRAHYNPAQPGQSVLVPGPVWRFNPHTLLPVVLFGVLLAYALVQSSLKFAFQVLFKVVIGALVFVCLVNVTMAYFFSDPHGLNGDYAVVRESPMEDGVEYWVAVGTFWAPWDDEIRCKRMLLEARDTQFIAADGTLQPIQRRKWTIFQINLHNGSTKLPPDATADWVMTWTPETGFHNEPVSEQAKREMKRHEDSHH